MAAMQAGPGDLPQEPQEPQPQPAADSTQPQKRRKLEESGPDPALTDEQEIATLLDGTPIDAGWLQVAVTGLIGRGVLLGGLAIEDQVRAGAAGVGVRGWWCS